MIPYWTIIKTVGKYLGPYIAVAIVAGGIAWKIQQVRLDNVKVTLQAVKQDLTTCQDVNATNQATITSLKDEVATANKLCGSRLATKENTIRALKRIDNLKTGNMEANHNEKGDITARGADAVLVELNRMYPVQTDRKN